MRATASRLYGRWIQSWEHRLCYRATNRVVRRFEWGLDWAGDWPCAVRYPKNGDSPEDYVSKLNQIAMLDSDDFFAYEPPSDFRLDDGILRFRSPVETPYPENNIVHAQWFPAKQTAALGSKKAVVLLPHWNAPVDGHNALCRGLSRLGISALRISLPYHDYRMPAELQRADYAVSANVCRTIDATRQAVIDVRCCFDWLESQGYERLGIVGTSLGSCYAYLASAHDARIAVNVFNHCSTYVADVVWTGLSTQHIRQRSGGAHRSGPAAAGVDGDQSGELHGEVRGPEAQVALHLRARTTPRFCRSFPGKWLRRCASMGWITAWSCCPAAITRWANRRSSSSTDITSARF